MTYTPDAAAVTMPALALRGINVFPHMLLHFDVAREASIKALDEAMSTASPIFLVTQRDLTVEHPQQEALLGRLLRCDRSCVYQKTMSE